LNVISIGKFQTTPSSKCASLLDVCDKPVSTPYISDS
jgi:hypothetical protein